MLSAPFAVLDYWIPDSGTRWWRRCFAAQKVIVFLKRGSYGRRN